MPLHEYKCKDCGFEFEELVGQDDSNVKCKSCDGEVNKKISTFSSVVEGTESIDVKIGKEAEQRWQMHHNRQEKRHSGENLKIIDTPKTEDGKYMPVMALGNKEEIKKRKEYSTALQEHRGERVKKGHKQFAEVGPF